MGCLTAAALLTGLTACDSYMDDNWKPGEKVAEGVQGAFFSTSNADGFSVSDDTEFTITVLRTDSTDAATVGINVVSRDTTAIEIPSSVTFEAGKGSTTLTCRAEGLTAGSLYEFTISVDSTQTNPYAAGTTTFTATVVNGSLWKNVITGANTYYYYNGEYTFSYRYKTTIMQYLETNYFYVDDFLNSGSGFTFKIKNADGTYPGKITNINTVDGILEPVNEEGTSVTDYGSYTWVSYYVGSSWGWTDTVNNVTYDSWNFYGGSADYAYFSGSGKYISLLCMPYISGRATASNLFIDWR